ncbi:hypothetical protein [Planococcus rifietoensis]|uniref:hypothetical protein n=1 Tax=Planococcus rifietoensis TaxID=200991 RepID=UPI00384BA427
MNGDYIQLSIAVVAVIAAVIATVNTSLIKKQINLQKNQWEFSQVPIFRISFTKGNFNNATCIVVENSNSVYHHIKRITLSSEDLIVEKYWNNFVVTIIEGEPREFHGLIVLIKPKTNLFCEGTLQISGVDALGNDFKANSIPLKFDKGTLKNGIQLTNSFLKKV